MNDQVDTTKMSVADIRFTLNRMGAPQSEFTGLVGKSALAKYYLDYIDSRTEYEEITPINPAISDTATYITDEPEKTLDILDELSQDDIGGELPNKDEDVEKISFTSPDWTDYVMSHILDSEKVKNHPTADGLRRVTELLFGQVISITSDVIQCPDVSNNARATVKVRVEVIHHDSQEKYITDGSADVYLGNTEQLYARHPVATAESRAESRAFRRMLRLTNILSAEENVDDALVADDLYGKITEPQIKLINTLCSEGRLNVNQEKLFEKYKIKDINDVSSSKALEICRELNSYQSIGVPEELKNESNVQAE